MIKKLNNPNGNAHRVITFLTRDELDFLDKIGKDALFSAGAKLSRSQIISAIVDVMRRLNFDGSDLSSKQELEARIIEAMQNISKEISDKSKRKAEKEETKGEQNDSLI